MLSGNQGYGLAITGRAYRNLISANTGVGVTLRAGTRMNWVISNYIGRGRFGYPLPNTGQPVLNLGRHNHILGNRT